MYFIGHRQTSSIDFDKCKIYSFLHKDKKMYHYSQWSQNIKSILVSKPCILLSSNLVRILKVIVLDIASVLMNLGLKFCLQGHKKEFFYA